MRPPETDGRWAGFTIVGDPCTFYDCCVVARMSGGLKNVTRCGIGSDCVCEAFRMDESDGDGFFLFRSVINLLEKKRVAQWVLKTGLSYYHHNQLFQVFIKSPYIV